MQILWAALCSSHFFLALALWFVRFGPAAQPVTHGPPPMFLPMFGFVALVQVALSFFMPAFLMRARLRGLKQSSDGWSDDMLVRLLPGLQVTLTLGLALCQSVTMLGFVLGFLGAPVEHFAPFFVVGALLSLGRFPSEKWLRSQIPSRGAL